MRPKKYSGSMNQRVISLKGWEGDLGIREDRKRGGAEEGAIKRIQM